MLLRTDHRPEVANDVGIIELGKRRLGDHFERFACRIRHKMEMDAGHGEQFAVVRHVDSHWHKPREESADNFGRDFAPRYRFVPLPLVDMGTAIPTGWG